MDEARGAFEGLVAEIDWRKALGYTEWEPALEEAADKARMRERAWELGFPIGGGDGGSAVFRLRGGADGVEGDDELALECCRRCALDRAYLDLTERWKGLGELPERACPPPSPHASSAGAMAAMGGKEAGEMTIVNGDVPPDSPDCGLPGEDADGSGARWQVSVYCGYLDVPAAHLGIDATYDAFVAKA